MKLRTCFVSNSSSSNFVVGFYPQKPASIEELCQLLFGETLSFGPFDTVFPTQLAAEQVWSDLKDQNPLTVSEIAAELEEGWLEGAPDYFRIVTARYDKERERYEQQKSEYYDRKTTFIQELFRRKFQPELNRGTQFYRFSYSDNDGEFHTALEHGDIFAKLPHLRISHH
jgi:hypothetical protein